MGVVSPTTVVAVYAAVVGTGSLVVAALTYRSSRTRLVLEVNPGLAPTSVMEYDESGHYVEQRDEVVFFHVTNKSSHPVKLSSIGGRPPDGGEAFIVLNPLPVGSAFPLEIPARDSKTLWAKSERFESSTPLKFFAETTAGNRFETKALKLEDQPRWELRTGQT